MEKRLKLKKISVSCASEFLRPDIRVNNSVEFKMRAGWNDMRCLVLCVEGSYPK